MNAEFTGELLTYSFKILLFVFHNECNMNIFIWNHSIIMKFYNMITNMTFHGLHLFYYLWIARNTSKRMEWFPFVFFWIPSRPYLRCECYPKSVMSILLLQFNLDLGKRRWTHAFLKYENERNRHDEVLNSARKHHHRRR